MDNLCHTLTGAALAQAGLARRTRFGTAALVVAANLPDVDIVAVLSSVPSVALRRGWTHGILAQLVLPALLAAAFVGLDRWRPPRAAAAPPLRPLSLLLLCYAGVLSHVGMDWLNTYGVRLLMPVSPRWFYGDAVFIIDPWLWLTLGAGVIAARRRGSDGPARAAGLAAGIYILLMVASASAARAYLSAAWTEGHGRPPAGLMVGPVPVNPLVKSVIVDAGAYYQRGTFRWFPKRLELDPDIVAKGSALPGAAAARADPQVRALLVWARFPYYRVVSGSGGVRVTVADMRFGDRLFTVTALVPAGPGGQGTPR
jgi:inner membrane protein